MIRPPEGRYSILLADPPWDYQGRLQHGKKGGTGGAARHYATVPTHIMKKWPVGQWAEDDALLFLWATGPHLPQAVQLGTAWGFQYATVAFVWDKTRVNPGYYTLSQHEFCLAMKKGRIPKPRGARNIRQNVKVKRGPHSEKPEEVRRRITAMFPHQRKLELFARGEAAPGWTNWGLEAQ